MERSSAIADELTYTQDLPKGKKMKLRDAAFLLIAVLVQLPACISEDQVEESKLSPPVNSDYRPSWLAEEPLIIVGNWDTAHIFRVRKGGNPVWHEDDYVREHTEEAVQKLKEMGVTMAVIHFYKGFGLEAEREQLEDSKKLAALCKKHGIRVGVYVGSTVGFETFLLEKPEAQEWFLPDYMGNPVRYGGTQTFRKRVYFMHPGFIEYMKKVLKIAIEELDVDLIHFDNTSLRAQRPAFHHPLAKEHFRAYLQKKFTSEELKQRLGFGDVTYVEPPLFEGPLSTIDDPLFQEWIDFRCQQLADFYGEMARYIRSLDPEVAVENNPHSGGSGVNTMWEQGIDYPRLLAHTDIVWTEEGNEAQVTEDGILLSKIRTYKQATRLGNKIFTYTSDSLVQLAEAMTFNRQCLGMVGGMLAGYELSEQRRTYGFDDPYSWGGAYPGFGHDQRKQDYIDFYRTNFNYYRGVETASEVAVLHSYATMAFNNDRPYQSVYLFEESLIRNHVPFDIIFDEHLADLGKYRVLVLADQECLSDRQIDQIRQFVANGGGLVATEHTSLYTERRQRRRDFGLSELFQVQPSRWPARAREPEPAPAGPLVRRQVGEGRVVYIPEIVPSVKKPAAVPMTSRFWQLPLNAQQLIESVRWAAGDRMILESKADNTVVMEVLEHQESGALLLHMINYDSARVSSANNLEIVLSVPPGTEIEEVRVLSPDAGDAKVIPHRLIQAEGSEARVSFTVPQLQTYNLVVVEPR